ncbi:MAG: hypothetical protein Q8K86_07065 [Candidatus Nanopelagicaceae bacterium]|nr:hypothetical protein [Candidatus Nanopelagicaceae bacterium]
MPPDVAGTGNGSGDAPQAAPNQSARVDADDEGRGVTIPKWVLSLLQWSAPAIVAITAAYYQVQSLEEKVTELRVEAVAKDVILDKLKTDVTTLQERLNGSNERTNAALSNINEQLRDVKSGVNTINATLMRLRMPAANP